MTQPLTRLLSACLMMLSLWTLCPAQQTSSPQITGAFFVWLNTPHWTQQRWDQEFAWMAQAGVQHIVMHCAALEGEAYYPTSLPWLQNQYGDDALERVYTAADQHSIKIYIYGYDDPHYWSVQTEEFFDDFAIKCNQVIDELWQRYGHHSSMAGFHLSPEFWYPADDAQIDLWVNHYIRPFADHVHGLNANLKVTTAPFIGSLWPYSSVFTHYDSDQYKAFWDKFLSTGCIDIMIPQDGIGADEHLEGGAGGRTYAHVRQIFQDTRQVADRYSVQLWDDLESFESVGICYPNHFARTRRQLAAASPYATNFLAFEWRYDSPSNSLSSVEFFRNCLRNRQGQELLQMVSRGCAYTASAPPATADAADFPLLTNGGMDGGSAQDYLNWTMPEGQSLALTLDLELVTPGIEGFAVHLRSDSQTNAPAETIVISVSSDGVEYTSATQITQPNALEGWSGIYEAWLNEPVGGRFVRFQITSARSDHKVECCEIAVFSTSPHWISKNAEYTFSQTPSSKYPDEGLELTDWEAAPRIYAQAGWENQQEPIEITMNLEHACELQKIEAVFMRKDKVDIRVNPCLLPAQVEVSYALTPDGFGPFKSLTAGPSRELSVCRYWSLEQTAPARYVRLRITPTVQADTNLMLSEIRVFGQTPSPTACENWEENTGQAATKQSTDAGAVTCSMNYETKI